MRYAALIVLVSLLAGCAPASVDADDLEIVCISTDDGVSRIYFRTKNGASCDGIRIEPYEGMHGYRFVPGGGGEVDVPARPFDGEPWGPCLVCEIELPDEVVYGGQSYRYFWWHRPATVHSLTTTPPPEGR